MKRFSGKNFYSLVSILVLGSWMVACAPLTGDSGDSTAGCITNQEDDTGAQVGLNEPGVTTPTGIVSGTGLAQAFYSSFSVVAPKVSIKLDLNAPTGTVFTGNINVSIQGDSTTSTSGVPSPTNPNGTPVVTLSSGASVVATSLVLANTIVATPTSPLYYDFCFVGGSGLNCGASSTTTTSTAITGVTLNSNAIYWVVVTAGYSGTSSEYIEWRAGNDSITGGLAAIFGTTWTPLVASPTLKTFDFKIGC